MAKIDIDKFVCSIENRYHQKSRGDNGRYEMAVIQNITILTALKEQGLKYNPETKSLEEISGNIRGISHNLFRIEQDRWYMCINQYMNCIRGKIYLGTGYGRIIDHLGTEYDMHNDAYQYFRPATEEEIVANVFKFKLGDKVKSERFHLDGIVVGTNYEDGWITIRCERNNPTTFPIAISGLIYWELVESNLNEFEKELKFYVNDFVKANDLMMDEGAKNVGKKLLAIAAQIFCNRINEWLIDAPVGILSKDYLIGIEDTIAKIKEQQSEDIV